MSETKSGATGTAEWFTPGRFAGLLAALVFVAYPQIFLGLQTFIYRDFCFYSYPLAFHLRESFWHGQIPLWDPLSYCGAPFLAQWNTQVLYPPALFYLVFPLTWSLPVFCLGHLYLGGLGMYFLMRRWTGNNFAAAFAGIIFAFNGLTLNCLVWPAFIPGFAWMPWLLLWLERAWREGGRMVVLAAAVGALQMLSGAVEAILMTWVLAGTLGLLALVGGETPRGRLILRSAAVGLLITGLCAAQLLPFLDLLAHSQRHSGFDPSLWPMPFTGWGNFLVPLFHCHRGYHDVFTQATQGWVNGYYSGVATVALAFWTLGRVRSARVWLFGLLVGFCLLLALGNATPVYSWSQAHLPIIGFMRFPIKFVILPVFVLPMLAAYAVAAPLNPAGAGPGRTRWSWLAAALVTVGLTLLVLWMGYHKPQPGDEVSATLMNGGIRLAFFAAIMTGLWFAPKVAAGKRRALLQVLILVLAWLDVFHCAPLPQTVTPGIYQPDAPRSLPLPRFGVSRALITHPAVYEFSHNFMADVADDYVSRRFALFSNCNLLDHLAKVDGFFPLQIKQGGELQQCLYGENSPDPLPDPLLDFLGVSQITMETNRFDWQARTGFMPLLSSGQRPVFASDTNVFAALMATNFTPRRTVYLPPEVQPFVTATNGMVARITAPQYAAQRIQAQVQADGPALIVIAQSYYHLWHAYVDGQAVPLWRANAAFQAVQVPAGNHELKLIYEDHRFWLGVGISLATLLGCLLGLWWWWPRS